MKIFAFFLLMFSAAGFSQQLNTSSPSKVRFLTSQPGAMDEWPCFSPDGKLVLFSRSEDKGKTWIFYIVPTAGGEATRFIRSPLPLPVSATRAPWSTRSNEIAFTRADGTGIKQLTDDSLNATHPVWSPTSEQIVFSARQPNGQIGTGVAVTDALP
jgi:Tol biopolymer transport system component